ncbi:hypothetical protein [Streptomyces sp. NBC_01789]|uniref:hypothetical protein n=1 Tax=Streptomyces sp. NBC_01789 TaxID=2975941 RepID=UPI00225191C7|nr:hypothetical protein [Streptomyces sp. NBC_01789]MCX4450697.1 hypothetical protein [Streptomyces sp. NBC_01789]
MNEPLAAEALCEHAWQYNKPAHATVAVRICSLCHTIDGEDLMKTLDEYAREQLAALTQKPTTLLYAHSDGETHSYVDQPGGIPDTRRERAVLRGILQHTLTAVAEREYGDQSVALHAASD